jgi:hypothetical protein
VLLALEFEGQVTEREVFEPASLGDTEFMRERFEWLWGRVLRASLKKQVDAPLGEVVVVEPVIHLPNG